MPEAKRRGSSGGDPPVNAGRDLLADLSILYDAARGFLGLHDPDEVVRHTLLSLMGACGAGSAAFLEPVEDGVLAPRAARGGDGVLPARIRLSSKAAAALLAAPHPLEADAVFALGSDWERLVREAGVRVVVPLARGDRLLGAFALGGRLLGDAYADDDLALLGEIAALAAVALATAAPGAPAAAGRSGTAPAPRARPRGAGPIDDLRARYPALRAIQGDGPWAHALFEDLLALADFDLPVLVLGETGTGKELVARALHELSPRAASSFEAINCAAIPPDLIASALFGHEKGAFTGAIATLKGAFERSGDGTIFLDEIGDMPAEAQASLLRALQERNYRRVGGEQVLPLRARVVSATNRDLVRDVEAGRFRADLFYRIQTYSLHIPPLRERKAEIPRLVAHFLERHRPARGAPPSPSPEFLEALARRDFPGNVRELESLVLGALVRARASGVLRPEHVAARTAGRGLDAGLGTVSSRGSASLAAGRDGAAAPVPSYDDMEREYISSVLRLTNGNRKQAAALMRIPRTTLNARMKKLAIDATG
jgi:transcriptional regulator with GAF, ATPase, and Fis domain